ncbi:probable fucosyltransferase 8 [Selaginella moellendorffii]|uniref:probable fucosyltransferase 8 n=1 Tax=Selaginella moellendorffii TaxID=88036 RepID=UPI000D1CC8B0|nr:probable fucosyltransferase 8 [Selaginella moellendorffii]|eukprot:XP_024520479.1 probable fucosyltransferase 8 [Selaginella moellendorffii]
MTKSYRPLFFVTLVFTTTALLLLSRNSPKMSLGYYSRANVNDDSCRSRAEYTSYTRHKFPSFRASQPLHKKILEYEALHARCAPDSKDPHKSCSSSCKFLVFVPGDQGIGNKMITLVSTFLYALLTDRVLLIARKKNIDTLFCEPFPSSSWLLPPSWKHLAESVPHNDSIRIGSLVGSLNCSLDVMFPEVVFADLCYNYKDEDKSFFCGEHQRALRTDTRWIVLSSDQYFAAALFIVPAFRAKLQEWFPQQEAVFHLLVRYLLYPVESVWDKTRRYYDAYLAEAEHLLGVQLRTHIWFSPPNLAEDAFDCLVQQKILPNITREPAKEQALEAKSSKKKRLLVLLTSLNPQYSEALRAKMLSYDLSDGTIVIHQPSGEGEQHTGNWDHDAKAVMEIYLLSMSEVLLTSPPSTFGYAAAGLAGVRPLQFVCDKEKSLGCLPRETMEPCYHGYPDQFMLANIEECECELGYRLS